MDPSCLMIIERRDYREDTSEIIYCGKEIDVRKIPELMGKTAEDLEREQNDIYALNRIHLDQLRIGNLSEPLELYVDQTFGPYHALTTLTPRPFSIPINKKVKQSLIDFLEQLELPDEPQPQK